MKPGTIRMVLGKFLEPFIGQTYLCRFLFCFLFQKIPLDSILKPAIQTGTPEEVRSVVEEVPLLGFLDILGLAFTYSLLYIQ